MSKKIQGNYKGDGLCIADYGHKNNLRKSSITKFYILIVLQLLYCISNYK